MRDLNKWATCLLLGFFLLVPGVAAQGPLAPHAQNVAEARHEPTLATRGVDVIVYLRLHDGANVRSVTLVYCRAENYACAPSVAMDRLNETTFQAPIRWHPGFFRDARNVGYNFTLRYEDGRNETSPLNNWPYTPDALPGGAGRYYFYPLEGADPASTPALAAPWLLGIGLLVTWASRRRDAP